MTRPPIEYLTERLESFGEPGATEIKRLIAYVKELEAKPPSGAAKCALCGRLTENFYFNTTDRVYLCQHWAVDSWCCEREWRLGGKRP